MIRYILFVCFLLSCNLNHPEQKSNQKITTVSKKITLPEKTPVHSSTFTIGKGSSFSQSMAKAGVDHKTIYHLAKSSKPTYKLSRVPAQTKVYVEWVNEEKAYRN